MKQIIQAFAFAVFACAIPLAAKAQTKIFETKSVVQADFNQTDATTGEIVLTIKEGWHVNANPASLDFLIPTEVTIPQAPKSVYVSYPDGHAIKTPLGDLMVYSEKTSIPHVFENGQKTKTISLTAQACDGSTSYPPSWTFSVAGSTEKE